jgi:shikimate kinase
MPPLRIALIGFMGAGKTTVGALLAARLGYTFIDTDAVVEQRAGAPVAVLFRERGEAAFREMEAAALAELAGRKHLVIASGGGAPAQARNAGFFAAAAAAGGTYHLRVSLQAALRRARSGGPRPLLERDEAAVRALFERRQPIYENLGIPVDTEEKEPAAVAEEIIRLLRNPRGNPAPAGSG